MQDACPSLKSSMCTHFVLTVDWWYNYFCVIAVAVYVMSNSWLPYPSEVKATDSVSRLSEHKSDSYLTIFPVPFAEFILFYVKSDTADLFCLKGKFIAGWKAMFHYRQLKVWNLLHNWPMICQKWALLQLSTVITHSGGHFYDSMIFIVTEVFSTLKLCQYLLRN